VREKVFKLLLRDHKYLMMMHPHKNRLDLNLYALKEETMTH
jgi:hypothetical protein